MLKSFDSLLVKEDRANDLFLAFSVWSAPALNPNKVSEALCQQTGFPVYSQLQEWASRQATDEGCRESSRRHFFSLKIQTTPATLLLSLETWLISWKEFRTRGPNPSHPCPHKSRKEIQASFKTWVSEQCSYLNYNNCW